MVEGNWTSFNLTWNPVTNVNFGTVFYKIKIDTAGYEDDSPVSLDSLQ